MPRRYSTICMSDDNFRNSQFDILRMFHREAEYLLAQVYANAV